MRRGLFLVIFSAFVCSLVFAQQKTSFFERNRKILKGPKTTILKSRVIDFKKQDFLLSSTSQRVYMKLKKPLTEEMLRKLKAYEINFNEYIDDDTYIVNVTQSNLHLLKKIGFIYGFENIDPADKLTKRLYKGEVSNYARENNNIKVVVSFYKDVTYSIAVMDITAIGGKVISTSFSRTHKLHVAIPLSNVPELSQIENVKYIEEVSPPATIMNIDAGKVSPTPVFSISNSAISSRSSCMRRAI